MSQDLKYSLGGPTVKIIIFEGHIWVPPVQEITRCTSIKSKEICQDGLSTFNVWPAVTIAHEVKCCEVNGIALPKLMHNLNRSKVSHASTQGMTKSPNHPTPLSPTRPHARLKCTISLSGPAEFSCSASVRKGTIRKTKTQA